MMAFCPEHTKWDQNLKFTPLSETTSIPTPFVCRVSPLPPGNLSQFWGRLLAGVESGRWDPDPAFPLLFHENPTSHTFFHLFPKSHFLVSKISKLEKDLLLQKLINGRCSLALSICFEFMRLLRYQVHFPGIQFKQWVLIFCLLICWLLDCLNSLLW